MQNSQKCLEVLDYSKGWEGWKNGLKQVIESSHTYYQDETVQVLLKQLDSFLTRKVCVASGEEEIVEAMWAAATPPERKTLANLFLKVSGDL